MDTWTLLAHRLLQALPHTGENSGERPGSSPDVFLLRLPPTGTGNIIVQVIFTVAGAAVAWHGHTSVVPKEKFTFHREKEQQNDCYLSITMVATYPTCSLFLIKNSSMSV